METNTVGIRNVALGLYSLGANTTGSYNIAIGLDSLRNNTTGQYNVLLWVMTALKTGVTTTGQHSNGICKQVNEVFQVET